MLTTAAGLHSQLLHVAALELMMWRLPLGPQSLYSRWPEWLVHKMHWLMLNVLNVAMQDWLLQD